MDRYHCIIVGDTGSGKTTFMREMHAEFDGLSIWVDDTDAGGISGRSGIDGAVSVGSLAEARRAQGHRLRWVCQDAMAVIDDVRAFAHEFAESGWPVQVIVDEAHKHLPDSEAKSSASVNTLAAMLHEDRDRGVKVVLGSQDPTDFYYPPIKQAKWIVWVGPPSVFHRGFKRYYSLDDLEGGALPTERFRYSVVRPSDPPQVVYEGETREEFA